MTPTEFKSIRERAGLTQGQLAGVLRRYRIFNGSPGNLKSGPRCPQRPGETR